MIYLHYPTEERIKAFTQKKKKKIEYTFLLATDRFTKFW